jgi:hypothetical protein
VTEPWNDRAPRPPSPDFAARVARAARQDFLARRRRRLARIAWGASALCAAAGVALLVRVALHAQASRMTAAIAPDEARVENGSVAWPLARGWTDEVYTFPLSFAPKLPYRGALAAHFPPAFAQPGASAYWSYVVAWVKAGAAAHERPDPRILERDLHDYYAGLCATGGHPGTHTVSPDFDGYEAHLAPAPLFEEDRANGGAWFFRGDLRTVDCIVTGTDLQLSVEAVVGSCNGETSFTAYALSPHPPGDPLWGELRAERRAFDCRRSVENDPSPSPPAAATVPETPAGRGLAWVLAALTRPTTESEVRARFTADTLAKVPPSDLAEAFAALALELSPPELLEVSEASPWSLVARVRSGRRDVPVRGREMRLAVEIDPADGARLRSVRQMPATDAPDASSPPSP